MFLARAVPSPGWEGCRGGGMGGGRDRTPGGTLQFGLPLIVGRGGGGGRFDMKSFEGLARSVVERQRGRS
jgi:hypothetical protein